MSEEIGRAAVNEFCSQLADRFKRERTRLSSDRESLYAWGKKFCPQYFFRPCSQLHIDLDEILESCKGERGKRVNIVAPRGNAKTTWVMIKILKAICEGSEKYILILSDTGDQARGILKSVRQELETNQALRDTYRLACAKGATWNDDRIETQNGVCLEALGTGQKIRGRKFRQYRPTLVLYDDPQNDEDVRSPTNRTNQWDWFNKALLNVGDKETNYIITGTMLHRECIVGMLEKDPTFTTIRYQAIITWPANMSLWDEWESIFLSSPKKKTKGKTILDTKRADEYYIEHKSAMEEGAEVLWADKENLYELMRQRAGKHAAFATEKQNDPRDPSKTEFREEWFDDEDGKGPFYDMEVLQKRLESEEHVSIGYGDPAKGGETKKHDYSAWVTLHAFRGERSLYCEIDMKKVPVNIFIDMIIEWHRQIKYSVIGIEDTSFQYLVSENLTARFSEEKIMMEALAIPNGGVHKNTRISTLGIWFQRKLIKFRRNDAMTFLLLQQILDHPFSDHDDGPDALEGAIRMYTSCVDPQYGDNDQHESSSETINS